jgi:hypothetical protein
MMAVVIVMIVLVVVWLVRKIISMIPARRVLVLLWRG